MKQMIVDAEAARLDDMEAILAADAKILAAKAKIRVLQERLRVSGGDPGMWLFMLNCCDTCPII